MTLNDGVEWKQSMVCVTFNVQTITYYTIQHLYYIFLYDAFGSGGTNTRVLLQY